MDGVSHRVGGFLLPSDAALEQLSGSGSYGTNADYSNAGMGYDSVLIHGTSKGEFRMKPIKAHDKGSKEYDRGWNDGFFTEADIDPDKKKNKAYMAGFSQGCFDRLNNVEEA